MPAAPMSIVLLRAVNVGGNNKVPMAQLRTALSDAGLAEVRTYIASGNIVCRTRLRAPKLAALVQEVIQAQFGLTVPVVALSADELREAVSSWPVPEGAPPKTLHCIVFEKALSAQQAALVAEQVEQAQAAGSLDHAEVHGRFVYLYTPEGVADSKLGRQLSSPRLGGTARNWNTAKTLLEMATNAP